MNCIIFSCICRLNKHVRQYVIFTRCEAGMLNVGKCVRRGVGQVDVRQVNLRQADTRSRLVRQADEMQAKERNEK